MEAPERDDAAVPRPGPPDWPVAAARDGEVQVRALVVGADREEFAPRTDPWPGSAAGGLRYAGVVGATVPVEPVEPWLGDAEVPLPVKKGYQAIERLLDPDEVDDVVEPGVGVGPAAVPSSSGRLIGVSGFRRRIGSPLGGISRESSVPCASFIRLDRPWFQVAVPVGLRQLKP